MELTFFSWCFLCQGSWWTTNCHPHHHLEVVLSFLTGKEVSPFLQQDVYRLYSIVFTVLYRYVVYMH